MTAFLKMHGLGNDFIVLDARDPANGIPDVIGVAVAKGLADRHFGIGCDQILVIRASAKADVFMQILNSDGSDAAACGNGTRCVADLVMRDLGLSKLSIETDAGILQSWRAAEDANNIAVDMGPARLAWDEVPLASPADTAAVDLGALAPVTAVCLSMGNPHAVLFVDNVEAVDLAHIGPQLEHHPLFPDRANISFVTMVGPDQFRMRVWERGGGITFACGSGACAVGVAVKRSGRGARRNEIIMDGGSVFIDWQDDGTSGGRVIMRGPVAYVFEGVLHGDLLALMRTSA
ncbi:diaminopimelate epimerase [Alphaproteobacteria bacterium]|nr:diaminopimelate epimerase [Alphaproteobacteria bacterium]